MILVMTDEMKSGSSAGEPEVRRLVCSEIWGGNQRVATEVELPGIQGLIYSRPCDGGHGGDVHYLSVCDSGLLSRLSVADVSGHGQIVAAASNELHTVLRQAMNEHDQRHVLASLNQHLERVGVNAMATAAVASYFPPTKTFSVSYAGHPPGYFYRKSRDVWKPLLLDESDGPASSLANLPLGVDAATVFTCTDRTINLGDRFLLISDGILETPDAQGALFGEDRLLALLHEHRHLSYSQIGEAVLDTLQSFAGKEEPQHDDVTFLLIEFVTADRCAC
jgi:sigma-B regulation protein RsbU (phosphoserine phosphatase)